MRNTPLKAFTKKGNSALKQVLKPEYTAPDLSFINRQNVSDSDTAINKSLDSNSKIKENIDNEIATRKSKIKPGFENLYDEKGNFKKVDSGAITKTAKDRFIEKQRDANPILGTIKGAKTAYDFFTG